MQRLAAHPEQHEANTVSPRKSATANRQAQPKSIFREGVRQCAYRPAHLSPTARVRAVVQQRSHCAGL